MRKLMSVALILFALLLALSAAACGGGGKKSVTVGDTRYTAGGSIPADFPKDFPIYSGAEFKGAVTSTQQGQKGFAATWQSGDSIDNVKSYYSEQFAGASAWTQDSVTDTGDGSFYIFHKQGNEGKPGFLTVTKQDGKTALVVFIGETPGASSDGDGQTSPTSSVSATSGSAAPKATSTGP